MKAVNKNLFLFLILLPVFLITFWILHTLKLKNQNNIQSVLKTVLSTTHSAVHVWSKQQKLEVEFWANNEEIKNYIKALVQNPKSEIYQKLDHTLTAVVERHQYIGYFVLNDEGLIVAGGPANLRKDQGLSLLGPEKVEFTRLQKLKSHLSSPFRLTYNGKDLAAMILVSPVISNGEFIALLGFHLDTKKDFTRTIRRAWLGITGETYAFNKNAQLITESRFTDELMKYGLLTPGTSSILNIQIRDPGRNLAEGHVDPSRYDKLPLTKMARKAVKGNSGIDLDGYRDYRGQKVVGAWLWDDELGFGLASEIDINEAKSVYALARSLIIFLIVFTILGAFLVALILWKKNTRLQEAVQIRDDFLSIASHELNTPLTSLMVQVSMINKLIRQGKLNEVSLEKLEGLVSVSNMQLRRFASLINDLLDISRIRTGRLVLNKEQVELTDIIQSVLNYMKVEIEKSKCPIILKCENIQGHWDRNKIQQSIINLVSNSLKYAAEKPIEIITQKSNSTAKIIVKDNGIGVDKIDQTRIFNQFEKASSIKQYGGLGLGLYITREIIEAHGGSIRVESDLGHGSTFIIELPIT